MSYIAKLVAILFITIAGLQHASAQNIREAQVKFMKGNQNAIIAEYELSSDMVEAALKDRFARAGFSKNKTEKGYMVWKGVSWPDVSPDKLDVYAVVDGKKDKSTVTLLVSKGYDNFIGSATDAEKTEKLKTFLTNFANDAKLYQLRIDIAAAEDLARMTENVYNKEVKDGNDLQQDLRKLEKKVEDNKESQLKTQRAWGDAKVRLEELKKQLPAGS